jgi:Rad52/22 family double-strand break repair protein
MSGGGYIDRKQWAQLIAPIRPQRVGHKDGQSHVEAYDCRAHLSRIFGFARWSEDVIDVTMLYEQSKPHEKATEPPRWRAAYRATVRLTVNAPDGTVLATYTETATGSNFGWLPDSKRDEAHDMAIKTAASQALKRCAINLGDQFGLSLYNKGSLAALVGGTIAAPPEERGAPSAPDVTAHLNEQLAPENPPAAQTPAPTDAAPQAPSGQDPVSNIRDRILKATRKRELATLLMSAQRDGVQGALTTDADGNGTTVEKLIQKQIAGAAA